VEIRERERIGCKHSERKKVGKLSYLGKGKVFEISSFSSQSFLESVGIHPTCMG